MAADIIKMKGSDGKVQYPVTSSEAVGMSDGSGNLDTKLTKLDGNTTIYCEFKQSSLPNPEDGVDGDYCILTAPSANRIYKKKNGEWVKQIISLSNIYRHGEDCFIKSDTTDASEFIRIDYLANKEISDNWYINAYYNLFHANNKVAFSTREEARKFWYSNVDLKYKQYGNKAHGVTIYYELTDGSKILEQFIGDTGSAYYYKDSEWRYILGEPNENIQSDFLENTGSRNFIKNKNINWGKGKKLSFGNNPTTANGEWIYNVDYSSGSHSINSNLINVTEDDMYLSFMATIYSEVDTDVVKLQVYNQTKKEYVYDKTISIKTFAQSYPVIVKVEKDNNYIIMIGKSACTAKYYVAFPFLYSVSVKPKLILFENDVDGEINLLKNDVVRIDSTIKSITDQELIYEDKNKYLGITTTFGECPVKPNDVLTIFIQTEYSDLANFRLYTAGASEVTLLYESGNKDLSKGLQVDYVVPNDYKYSAITFRTGVAGTISLLSVNKFVVKSNDNIAISDWAGKTHSSYGDSVTAINNGDFEAPFILNKNSGWGVMVAKYLGFSKSLGRGIGGQTFAWGSNGGSVAFINADGTFNSRNDSYNYDNYDGNVEVPEGTTPVRGCSCSWLRIKTMYPEPIKDTIDVITIMYHNDYSLSYDPSSENVEFVESSEIDKEWKSSEYYSKYNGDYNIKTVKGGIASTIMKMQAWMPNAILVLCTPISGRMDSNAGADTIDTSLKSNMVNVAIAVKEVANIMSIPCIDVYGTDGINGLNRDKYISDGIHPYKLDGKKMVARAIIGGLKGIIPNIYTDIVE